MSSEATQGWKASKSWLGLLAGPLNIPGSREPFGEDNPGETQRFFLSSGAQACWTLQLQDTRAEPRVEALEDQP